MPADIPQEPNDTRRRLWALERPEGHVFSCELERSQLGWMVWFSVDGQRVGGHRFEALSAATEWADVLLSELAPLPGAPSYARR